ncbi:integral membrane Pth11-like protein [Rutstroemia sp. NJR-2017a BBW]|nr:integral membrane Pth11-like protein [Rutstroemia sp. NJR-2017a BBW]
MIDASTQRTTTASAVVAVLSVIAVALRFFTRRLTRAGIASDDWWILGGVISFLVTGSLILYGVKSDPNGGDLIDRDSPTFDYAPHTTYLKISFIIAILYFTVVTAIKISILLMYRRIFTVSLGRAYPVLMSAIIMWWLSGTIATIVSCIPVNRLWVGPSTGGYCFNFNIFWMAMGVVEILVDSCILVLPVRIVLGLHMSNDHKVLVSGIFLLGRIVRVILGYAQGSQNVDFSKAELWSAVHVGMAIVCACLPSFRPLLTRITTTARRIYSSAVSSGKDNTTGTNSYIASQTAPSRKKRSTRGLSFSNGLESSNLEDASADTAHLTREESGEVSVSNQIELINTKK